MLSVNFLLTLNRASTPRIITYTTPEDVADFTLDNPVTKSGATITYGPYNNVPSSANNEFISKYQQRVTVHYYHDQPVLEILSLSRTAEISHWGANLNIQDDIHLYNAGPTYVHLKSLYQQHSTYTRVLTIQKDLKVIFHVWNTNHKPTLTVAHLIFSLL